MKQTTSDKLIKQKNVERVGGWDNMTEEQVWNDNPNGRPGLDSGYTQTAGGGNSYATMIKNSPAFAHATTMPGKTADGDKSLAATLARGEKLQRNAETVRQVNPDANKGLAKKLAQGNDENGNPKKRTVATWGIPTKD